MTGSIAKMSYHNEAPIVDDILMCDMIAMFDFPIAQLDFEKRSDDA